MSEKSAPDLAMKLKQQLACMDFQEGGADAPPRMVLQLVNDCFGPIERVQRRIMEFLTANGIPSGGVVVPPASDAPRPETVGEEVARIKSEAHAALVDRTREHPLVKELSARFHAEIIDVESIADGSVG